FNNIVATVSSVEQIQFSFNYQLSKNSFVEAPDNEHSITLEFIDNSSDLKFSKSFSLETSAGDLNLELGNHTARFTIDDPFIIHRIHAMNNYTLKVYDEFMGQKKLLAEKKMDWFTVNN